MANSRRHPTTSKKQVDERISTSPNIDEEDERVVDLHKSPTTFTSFPSLPTEIRLKIWKLACPRGRIIELMSSTPSKILLPVIAHIDQESRSEALRIYNVGFRHTRSTIGKVWWNPSVDTIYIANGSHPLPSYHVIVGPDVSLIRHLALDFELERFLDWPSCINIRMLQKFDALETLCIVVDLHFSALDMNTFMQAPEVQRDIENESDLMPCKFEEMIMHQLEKSEQALGKRWKVPTIKIVSKWKGSFWHNGLLREF